MAEPPSKQQKTDNASTDQQDAATARATGTMQSSVSKETPILIPPTITYGLQDTHTTILPAVFWISAPRLHHNIPKTLKLRLNSIYDIIKDFPTNVSSTLATDTQFCAKKCVNHHYAANASVKGNFPRTIDTSTPTLNLVPWWRDYFAKIYNFYTVLGCEYEIVIMNPRRNNQHALISKHVETSGTTNARIIESYNLEYLFGQKNIEYYNCYALNDMGTQNMVTIRGYYKPGQAKKDVANDGDVKLWLQTTAAPTYNENLHLDFFEHPLAANDNSDSVTDRYTNINMQVRLKYTVQFKDLIQAAYAPGDNQNETPQWLPSNAVSFPTS